MSAAVRSASVAVMGRHYPAVCARARHSLWCITSARAVKPERSKKFFASRAPGSAYGVDPDAPAPPCRTRRSARRSTPPPRPPGPRARRTGRRSRRAGCRRAASRSRPCRSRRSCRRSCRRRSRRRRGRAATRGCRRAARAGPRASTRARPRAGSRISARSAARQLDEHGEVGRARPLERAPLGRLPGELFDLAENRAPLPVRRLVRVHRVELVGREADEPLDDLRRRQRVVAGDREPGAAREVAVREIVARRPPFDAKPAARRGGDVAADQPVEPASAAPVGAVAGGVGAGAAARGGGTASEVVEPKSPSARCYASATVRSTRWRTIGGPNANATWPRLRAVVTRCCTSSWRRSISARPA